MAASLIRRIYKEEKEKVVAATIASIPCSASYSILPHDDWKNGKK